jgi:fumarate hydratase class II
MMPGKVNPVICESVTQVSAQVIGNDAAVTLAGLSGHLELNAFVPVIARNLLESIRLLANVSQLFVDRCLEDLDVDRARAASLVEGSLAMVTALVPVIGHDAAASIAAEAFATGRTVRAVCMEKELLPADELDRLLDPRSQTGRPD